VSTLCHASDAQARSRVTGRKPEDYFQFASLPDPVVCGDLYPRVAIQLPMFNERAVCQAAIDSACEQTWPKGRLFVQVNIQILLRHRACRNICCVCREGLWVSRRRLPICLSLCRC
jgi:hypothetical protein